MTARQKAIVALLASLNVAVIAGLSGFVVRGTRGVAEAPPATVGATPSPLPTPFDRYAASITGLERDCSLQAAQLLAYTGLGGAAAWRAGDGLRLQAMIALGPEQGLDDAAQAVWTAFDVALALRRVGRCAGFRQVWVTVVATGDGAGRIEVRASAEDLAAYRRGALDEAALIEQVEYAVQRTAAP